MVDVAVRGPSKPLATRTAVPGSARFLGLLAVATAIPWLALPYLARTAAQGGLTAQSKTLLLFLGSGVHVAASYAFYLDPDLRPLLRANRGRYLLAPVLVVLGTGAVLAAAGTQLTASIVLMYLVWQTHHYTRQNVGVFAFAARARRSPSASDLERAAITTAGFAGVIGMVTFIAPYEDTPIALVAMYAHNVAILVFLGALGLVFLCIPRALDARDPVRFAFLVGGVIFYLPTFIYRDPISAVTSYAIAHGFQYLIFMGYVATAKPHNRRRMVLGGGLMAAAGGLVLWHMQYARTSSVLGGGLFGIYLGLVMAHFIIDAGVWRLSEAPQRRYMAERFTFLA